VSNGVYQVAGTAGDTSLSGVSPGDSGVTGDTGVAGGIGNWCDGALKCVSTGQGAGAGVSLLVQLCMSGARSAGSGDNGTWVWCHWAAVG
jgi:hypothetical protein